MPTPAATPPPPDGDFLKIDELRLDKEWIEQAEIYYRHATGAAKAQHARDEAKSNLDVVRAELSSEIRANPAQYGLEKVTEGTVEAAVLTSPKYAEAVKRVNESNYRLNIRQAAVSALEHRKRALTMLVELHNSNYFADPKVQAGRGVREKMSEAEQRAAAKKTQIRRDLSKEED